MITVFKRRYGLAGMTHFFEAVDFTGRPVSPDLFTDSGTEHMRSLLAEDGYYLSPTPYTPPDLVTF